MLRSLALAGALALACVPAHATVTISDSPGGVIHEFVDKFQMLRESGQTVRIEGYCNSACTTIIGIVPRERICVAPGASLGFHSGATKYQPDTFSALATSQLRHYYAADVLRILRRHGWNARSPHPKIIPIEGRELRSILRPCNS